MFYFPYLSISKIIFTPSKMFSTLNKIPRCHFHHLSGLPLFVNRESSRESILRLKEENKIATFRKAIKALLFESRNGNGFEKRFSMWMSWAGMGLMTILAFNDFGFEISLSILSNFYNLFFSVVFITLLLSSSSLQSENVKKTKTG